jgi:arginase
VGSLAGLKEGRHGILWLDAHGDFNTPESTITGFLDGMGLAMAAGRCWKALLSTVPGFKPVAEDCIIHVGSRDLDPEERRSLSEARIPLVAGDPKDKAGLLAALHHALMPLKQRVDGIYLHVDLDVLETEQGKPNHLAVAGGLPLPLVLDAIEMIVQHFKIEACALASFDPDCDENHAVLKAGFRIIQAMVSS